MSQYRSSNERRSLSETTNELPCLFQPSGIYQGLNDSFDQVPPYLFRTWAPQTNGSNDTDFIRPAAVCNNKPSSDLFSFDHQFGKTMLSDHILWKNRFDDNLTSWTSSLLYALQLARHRNALDRRKFTYAGNINICVVDTRKFNRKTFLPAPTLLAAYSVPSYGKLTHGYSEGEFLSQGILDIRGKSKVESFENLLSRNLMDVFPPDLPEHKLWYAVQDYRRTWVEDKPIEEAELKAALSLASHCFNGKFYLAMVTMFLALKPRSLKDKHLTKITYDERDKEPLSAIEAALTKMKQYPNQPIEVMEYVRIMDVVVTNQRNHECESQNIAELPASNSDIDALGQLMGSFTIY